VFCAYLVTAESEFHPPVGVDGMGDGGMKVAGAEDGIGMGEDPAL
jgi:hypothetical protein